MRSGGSDFYPIWGGTGAYFCMGGLCYPVEPPILKENRPEPRWSASRRTPECRTKNIGVPAASPTAAFHALSSGFTWNAMGRSSARYPANEVGHPLDALEIVSAWSTCVLGDPSRGGGDLDLQRATGEDVKRWRGPRHRRRCRRWRGKSR
jgi:hypothetical protein